MLDWLTLSALGAAGAAIAAPALYLAPQARRIASVADMRRRCREQRAVVLTYDDGPGPDLTPRILESLRAHDAHATFFLLGFRAVARPDLVDRLVAAGHEPACHTMHHTHGWKTLPGRSRADVREGYSALSRWVAPAGLFRPPYGKLNLAMDAELRRRGSPTCWWTIDARDTRPAHPSPEQMADEVARQSGGVVLLHDFDRDHQHAERSTYVLRTTDLVLARARREGLCALTLGHVLGAPYSP